MKRVEQLKQYRAMSLLDLRKEIDTLENQLHSHRFALALNKSKQVSTAQTLRRQIARLLTVANQKLLETSGEKAGEE